MKKTLEKYGEPWDDRFLQDFDIDENATRVADFFNNGGLEMHNGWQKQNCAVIYVALVDGKIDIGCWLWMDDEDFDEDAEWHILGEDSFTPDERETIKNKIIEIYGD